MDYLIGKEFEMVPHGMRTDDLENNSVKAQKYLKLGNIALQEGNIHQAIEYLEKAVDLGHDNSQAQNSLGVAYLMVQDHNAALASFNRSILLRPGNIEARFNIAMVYGEMDDPISAIEHLEFLVSANLADFDILCTLYKFYIAGQEFRKAYDLLMVFRKIDALSIDNFLPLMRDLAEAMDISAQNILPQQNECGAISILEQQLLEIEGDILNKLGNKAASKECYLKGYKNGNRSELFISKIETTLASLNEPLEELNFLRILMDDVVLPPKKILRYGLLASSYDQWNEAMKTLEKLIGKEINHPDFYLLSGLCQQYQGQYIQATESFLQALKMNPKVLDSYYSLPLPMNRPGSNDESSVIIIINYTAWPRSQKIPRNNLSSTLSHSDLQTDLAVSKSDIKSIFHELFVQGNGDRFSTYLPWLLSSEDEPYTLLIKGLILSKHGYSKEALKQWSPVMRKGDFSQDCSIYASIQRSAKGNNAGAIRDFENILKKDPENITARLNRNALTRKIGIKVIPGILINTVPKSGSMFIVQNLSDLLEIPFVYISKDNILIKENLFRLSMGQIITQEHLTANNGMVSQLSKYIGKMVFHVREPRQTTLSYVHYINKLKTQRPSGLPKNLPDGYFDFSFLEQLEYQVKHGALHWFVSMIDSWYNLYIDPDCPLSILLTDFRDLKADSGRFFRKILSFYELEDEYKNLKLPPPDPNRHHYRSGKISEWKDVYPQHLKEKASTMIPNYLLEFFHWDKE